jgi:hypothetical protein
MTRTTMENPKTRTDRPASRHPGAGSFTHDLMVGVRSWARHTFSVASLISGLKSLLWVAPLSVIIWIYAEQQDISGVSATIAINVHSSDPTRVVHLVDPADAKLTVEMEGTNDNLQHIRDQLASSSTERVDIPQSILATAGNQTVPATIVSDLDVFRSHFITVKSVLPRDLVVAVDVLKPVELTVEASPDGKAFSAPPVFTPRKVQAMVPESLIQPAKAAGKFVAYAKLEEAKEPLMPGANDLTAVPVSVTFGDNISVTPSAVSAHVEIKKSDVTGQVPSIPIWAIYPPTIEDTYKAVYDPQTLTKVVITGPEELVNKLVNQTYSPFPKATFEVSPLLSGGVGAEQQARLHFDPPLPPDVHVSPDTQMTITYHLIERRAAE